LSDALSAEAVAAVDSAGQTADILALPEHLDDALWRVESAGIEAHDAAGGLIVAGMGGSAVGGLLAAAALGDRASRPIITARDYALPPWATPAATVLCASYSGNTEETIACFEAAGALGARRIALTTGGRLAELAREAGVPVIPMPAALQPRAAVGYMTVSVLEVATLAGVAQSLRSEVDVAAAHLRGLLEEWGPAGPADGAAKQLARALQGSVPVISGAGPTGAVAYRWKTQINENAKIPAFASELPELDHNEIVGWEHAKELGTFSAVFLDDQDLHPRVKQRIRLTQELIAPGAEKTIVIDSRGESRLERVLSLVVLGDLVSLYLAVLAGIDPSPVPVIESLKDQLGRP
jgi:glucose/mannose-6-phosphate isomerase